MGTRCSFPGA